MIASIHAKYFLCQVNKGSDFLQRRIVFIFASIPNWLKHIKYVAAAAGAERLTKL